MNHHLLNQKSEVFVDDTLERVDKRCFFLMCGKTTNDAAVTIDVSINALDDPAIKKKIGLSIIVDNILIEYGNEIFKNLIFLIL